MSGDDMVNLVCGGIAGCTSRTIVSPLERLKILYQVQYVALAGGGAQGGKEKYLGMRQALMKIFEEEGVKGFFRGNGANCIRVFPYVGIQFLSFERYKNWFLQNGVWSTHKDKLNAHQKLLVGALSGTTSVIFTYPLDFARARLTVQGGVSNTAYRGMMHVMVDATRTEGFQVLFRGMVPTLIGVAPYVGVNYLVYETLKELAPRPNGDKRTPPSAEWLAMCGAVAGTTGQTVAYPMDLLRRRFQVVLPDGNRMYSSVWNGISTIVRREGFLGLYKGFAPNFVKVVPTIAVMFWTNDMLQRMLGTYGYK